MTNLATIVAVLAVLPLWADSVNPALAADRPPLLIEFESPLAGRRRCRVCCDCPRVRGPRLRSFCCMAAAAAGVDWTSAGASCSPNWGYVTLTVDRFGTRGITSACTGALPPSTLQDAYRALNFLVEQPSVDPGRVAVAGFSQGAMLALLAVERGQIERSAGQKFRAAIGFYPPCLGLKGNMTVPTLILIGELDDWTPAKECRNLAEGRDDWGISREQGKGVPVEFTVYPGAYHDFDVPRFRTPKIPGSSPRIQRSGAGSIRRRRQEIPVRDHRRKEKQP